MLVGGVEYSIAALELPFSPHPLPTTPSPPKKTLNSQGKTDGVIYLLFHLVPGNQAFKRGV